MAITKDNIFDMVEPWINYIVVDPAGDIYGFEAKPDQHPDRGWNNSNDTRWSFIQGFNIIPWCTDWKQSLISRHADHRWIRKLCWVWDARVSKAVLNVLTSIRRRRIQILSCREE